MDLGTIIAVCLVAPAICFLLVVAGVSGLRMPRRELRMLLWCGLASLPVAVACGWMQNQGWMRNHGWVGQPWQLFLGLIGGTAGFMAAYALIAGVAVAIRSTTHVYWRWR